MDGFANWLQGQIDISRVDEECDEYLAGRQSGLTSALNVYKAYIRTVEG